MVLQAKNITETRRGPTNPCIQNPKLDPTHYILSISYIHTSQRGGIELKRLDPSTRTTKTTKRLSAVGHGDAKEGRG
jgi:hypothetical protein